MYTFDVPCADGITRTVTTYTVNEFEDCEIKYDRIIKAKRCKYVNIVATFDIETSTIKQHDKVIGFMYHWQFYIGGFVFFGRTWDEYITFIGKLHKVLRLDSSRRIVIWVHNLSFEFQFIRRFFEWDNVFAKKRREVLRAVSDGCEYRCSYYLTNMSLAKACENAKHCVFRKLDGDDFDYHKLRTPTTPMSDYELGYCYCDVHGLAEVIEGYLEEDNLYSIPMTSTGFIRRECRNAMRKNPKNREMFKRTALSVSQYKLLQDCKRGGNTACNRGIAGTILNNVKCIDISSSYPFQMMCQYFPMSSFWKVRPRNITEFEKHLDKYCCMFRVVFKNLHVKNNVPVPYIPLAKLTYHTKDMTCFNGRVLYTEACEIAMTEIDYTIMKKQYTWDEIAIGEMYAAKRGDLPQELKNVIIEQYVTKTELKGVDSYLYAKRKNLLNGIFGMACTDPVHDIIEIDDDGVWQVQKGDIQSELDKFYKSRNSFLPIQWGVWVTAHARNWLQRAIDITGVFTYYVDTDSDKFNHVDDHAFDEINEEAKQMAIANKAFATDKYGVIHYMGVFEFEEPYERFCTWGSKKYAYEQDGKLHITIAGVGKKKGAEFLDKNGGLKAFKPGFVWTEGHGGGTESHWNDDNIYILSVNGEKIKTAANVGILDSTYTLGITGEFAENMGLFIDNIV